MANELEKTGSNQRVAHLPPAKRRVMAAALLLICFVVVLGLAELGLRLLCRSSLKPLQDERSLLYRYDPVLGWFPRPNSTHRVVASRPFTVTHNSEGFRGPERAANNKPTMLFLGDSFVWGYDVEASDRFTEKLQARHPEWNVYNMGVSGYGTDQEFLLLQMKLAEYKPKVVFLVYCTETDDDDNRSNVRYGGYFKPYCAVAAEHLEVHGIPVPRSEHVFLAEHPGAARSYLLHLLVRGWFGLTGPRVLQNPSPTGAIVRAMSQYVSEHGAAFLVGLTQSSAPIEQYLRYYKIPFVDLDTPLRYPKNGAHWTPEGHTVVCDKIERFLQEENYLSARGTPP